MGRVCAGYSLAEDIPMLVQRGFIGASAESEPEYGSSAINFYLAAKLMWDSGQPLEPILADYYQGMYGPAAAPMRAFFEGIVATCRARGDRGSFFADEDYGEMATALDGIARTPGLSEKQRGRIAMTQDFLRFTTLLHEYRPAPPRGAARADQRLRRRRRAAPGVHAGLRHAPERLRPHGPGPHHRRSPAVLVGTLHLALPAATPAETALTLAPVVRTRQVIALLVQPGEALQADVQLRRLGRYIDPVGYVVLDADGNTVAQGEAKLEGDGHLDLPAADPGVYTLVAESGSNAASVVSPLRGTALCGHDIPFLGPQPGTLLPGAGGAGELHHHPGDRCARRDRDTAGARS